MAQVARHNIDHVLKPTCIKEARTGETQQDAKYRDNPFPGAHIYKTGLGGVVEVKKRSNSANKRTDRVLSWPIKMRSSLRKSTLKAINRWPACPTGMNRVELYLNSRNNNNAMLPGMNRCKNK
jgi:hypothetical protein